MYPFDGDATGMLGRSMQDPLYWRERDPQFISYVQRSFQNVFGEDVAAQDATGRLVMPEPRATPLEPFRPDVSPGDIEIGGGVGEHQPNRWRDVYAVQKGLSNTSHYALDLAKERSGRYSPALRGAIESFQREHREDVDGLLIPGGPTIERLRNRIAVGLPAIQPAFFGDPTEFPTRPDDAPSSQGPGRRPSFRPRDDDRATPITPAQDTQPVSPSERVRRTHRQAEDRSMDRLVPYAVTDLPGRLGDALSSAPLLHREADRRKSIIDNAPGRIIVREDPSRRGQAPWHAVHAAGQAAVEQFDGVIVREARRAGIDPDIVRAIMYVENAQGWYGKALEGLVSKSILPMNIRYDVWGRLGFSERDFYDATINVRAGTMLLRRILDRVEDPTLSKVATLYNSLAKDSVTEFGARVAEVYRLKPWARDGRTR